MAKMILIVALATSTALTGIGGLEAAGQPLTVDTMLAEASALFREANFVPTGSSSLTGELGIGEHAQESLYLEAGRPHVIAGVCGLNCSDINLRLLNPRGTLVAEDTASDDAPMLLLTPDSTGDFTLEISMLRCVEAPCDWGIQAYSISRPVPAVEITTLPQRTAGALGPGDAQYPAGELFDTYEFYAREGQAIVVDLRSDDFDTYLSVESPSGQVWTNDDYADDSGWSRLEVVATDSSPWTVYVTSDAPATTGAYVLEIDALPELSSSPPRSLDGSLTTDDQRLKDGRFSDTHEFRASAGDRVTIDLRSDQFDPVLMLFQPNWELVDENDDYQGSTDHSRLAVEELQDSGEYRVVVTSYGPNALGPYALNIAVGTDPAPSAQTPILSVTEQLEATDIVNAGRYEDEYTVPLIRGVTYLVDLRGSFDTFLEVSGPDLREQNDDADSVSHSALEVQAPATGEYRIVVTSFSEGATGTYDLDVVSLAPTLPPPSGQALVVGPNAGALTMSDQLTDTDHYYDYWTVEGQAGDILAITLLSDDFDTVLALLAPDGTVIEENDDDVSEGADSDPFSTNSRISSRLPATGEYGVRVTSYSPGATGRYEAHLVASGGDPTRPGSPQIYGIFVGVSDYGSRLGDLPYTASDAHRIRAGLSTQAGMLEDNAIVLTDEAATETNVRAAFESMRDRVGATDTFVFFFSGHGDRVPQQGATERWDLDGLDETIEVVDAALTDNALNDLLNQIDSGLTLVVLDSCFSGGFSKDVISVENRIGFFSSEEDVTSLVADKFAAGGYLALFFAEALGDGGADANGDGTITSLELRTYLHDRYRGPEEKSADDFVRALDFSQQHLVVDSGSVEWSDVLFRLPLAR